MFKKPVFNVNQTVNVSRQSTETWSFEKRHHGYIFNGSSNEMTRCKQFGGKNLLAAKYPSGEISGSEMSTQRNVLATNRLVAKYPAARRPAAKSPGTIHKQH